MEIRAPAVLYIVYTTSLWAAAAASQTFFVFSTPIIVLLLAIAYLPPLIATTIFPDNEKAPVVVVHIFAALALYPPLLHEFLNPWYLEPQEQFQLLRQVVNGESNGLRLAASLRDEALADLQQNNPGAASQ